MAHHCARIWQETNLKLSSVVYLTVALLCTILLTPANVLAVQPVDHQIVFTENGDLAKSLNFPVYEWQPVDDKPSEMVLAIHGLTLHGKSYSLLGKAFAAGGFYFVSCDMRGFGLCQPAFSAKHEWCKDYDCKWKVDYAKSFHDIVRLAHEMRKKYPDLKLTVIGESWQNVKSGLYAALISPRFQMNLHGFISKLVSNNPLICQELLDDPLIRKKNAA